MPEYGLSLTRILPYTRKVRENPYPGVFYAVLTTWNKNICLEKELAHFQNSFLQIFKETGDVPKNLETAICHSFLQISKEIGENFEK